MTNEERKKVKNKQKQVIKLSRFLDQNDENTQNCMQELNIFLHAYSEISYRWCSQKFETMIFLHLFIAYREMFPQRN